MARFVHRTMSLEFVRQINVAGTRLVPTRRVPATIHGFMLFSLQFTGSYCRKW